MCIASHQSFVRACVLRTYVHLAPLFVGSAGEIERVRKAKDYAFIHFRTRECAEQAFAKTTNKDDVFKIDDSVIEVAWGKPVDKQSYNARKILTKIFTEQQQVVVSSASSLSGSGHHHHHNHERGGHRGGGGGGARSGQHQRQL